MELVDELRNSWEKEMTTQNAQFGEIFQAPKFPTSAKWMQKAEEFHLAICGKLNDVLLTTEKEDEAKTQE